jgi:AcrR family transcriptional regulator
VVKPSGQTGADTKTRILDAADEIFVRRGIDGAHMQEIADQAGVNKALLHYHFQSKAELARAVWLRIASSFVPGIFQMMRPTSRSTRRSIDSSMPITPGSQSTPIYSAMSLAKRRDILISPMTSTRLSDGRPHDGHLSVWNSRSTNAPSEKRSSLSRLISFW